jgi:sporulation protein YlmC with PRC-barrel domain
MLKSKKVITNDGKEIGEIREISDSYIPLEKGTKKG